MKGLSAGMVMKLKKRAMLRAVWKEYVVWKEKGDFKVSMKGISGYEKKKREGEVGLWK